MNPWGLFLIVIGFLVMVIGIKGTQGQILSTFKNIKQGQTSNTKTSPSVLPPGLQQTVG